jgi:hypothetical protein
MLRCRVLALLVVPVLATLGAGIAGAAEPSSQAPPPQEAYVPPLTSSLLPTSEQTQLAQVRVYVRPAPVYVAPAPVYGVPGPIYPRADFPRFRGGISLGAGGLFVSDFGVGLGVLDGRLGVQINNLIGIYAQPHFSVGGGTVNGVGSAITGEAGATLLVDFTFFDRFFVGVGGGGGVIGSLGAGELHIRLGGYPLLRLLPDRVRRRGLMLGIDTRVYFVEIPGATANVVSVAGSIGFEAF